MNKYREALNDIAEQCKDLSLHCGLGRTLTDTDKQNIKTIEEAIAKAKKYDDIENNIDYRMINFLNSKKKNGCVYADGFLNGEVDKIINTFKIEESQSRKFKFERDEALKRIEKLEQKNKVLVEGVKALLEHAKLIDYSSYDGWSKIDFNLVDDLDRGVCYCGAIYNEEETPKIKAMLEVVEE